MQLRLQARVSSIVLKLLSCTKAGTNLHPFKRTNNCSSSAKTLWKGLTSISLPNTGPAQHAKFGSLAETSSANASASMDIADKSNVGYDSCHRSARASCKVTGPKLQEQPAIDSASCDLVRARHLATLASMRKPELHAPVQPVALMWHAGGPSH